MKKLQLRNGMEVVLAPMKGTESLTMLIMFKVGSRNETPATNGISHFLEHLFFKGTEHRPTTLEVSKELDGVGAEYNAFTGKDYTGYYVKIAKKHSLLAPEMLEDLLFHPLFEPAEIDRERGVIIEEINMYDDNPMSTAEEMAEQLLFGKEHPLGYQIAGPKKNILRVSREEILQYRNAFYHPNNMVIVLAGAISERMVRSVRRRFEVHPKSVRSVPKRQRYVFAQKAPRIGMKTKKTAQAHLALTFPGPSYTDPAAFPTNVLSTILGGTMSSRLFINVRDRKGLCYYINSGVSPYEDCGAITIRAGFDIKRIDEAIQAIISELVRIRRHGITDEELQKAKDHISGKTSIHIEDSEYVASWWARTELFRKKHALSPTEYLKRIQAVRKNEVHAMSHRYFKKQYANMYIIGPYSKTRSIAFKKYLQF